MLTLLKNSHLYAPEDLGKKDVLIANDKIAYIGDSLDCSMFGEDIRVYDLAGAKSVPGFIDQHVHIIGGGEGDSLRARPKLC